MKLENFNPPANQDDFGSDALLAKYSKHVSDIFDASAASVQKLLTAQNAGTVQFYNPVAHGIEGADVTADIAWNGFPRMFLPSQPGKKPNYAAAEQVVQIPDGRRIRRQDEYLEWFVHRDANNKIVAIDFTCEAYDYFELLAEYKPDAVVALYQKYISPKLVKGDLFSGGEYNPWNAANLDKGAMHLTHPANALGAEIKLAADATVRRKGANGAEPANASTLIKCAQFGGENRNSDPKIGFDVNQLARAGYMITLADPVGLYMVAFDDVGWAFTDGTPATGFFTTPRGKKGQAIRGRYELPDNLKAKGLTVSDVQIGGVPIEFGGQIAEHITMGIRGLATKPGSIKDSLVPCGITPADVALQPAKPGSVKNGLVPSNITPADAALQPPQPDGAPVAPAKRLPKRAAVY